MHRRKLYKNSYTRETNLAVSARTQMFMHTKPGKRNGKCKGRKPRLLYSNEEWNTRWRAARARGAGGR